METHRDDEADAHDRRMLRLDPAHPPLWRDATTLQFGLDPVVILDAPEEWQGRLVRELEHGIPPVAVEAVGTAVGAAPGEASAFVRRLRRALVTAAPPPRRPVVLQASDGMDPALVGAVADALALAGHEPAREPYGPQPAGAALVLLAHHVVEPRRAALAIGRDLPHLPLVFGGSAVEIGPYVRPGVTACLACLAAAHLDADPAWPQLAAQAIGRRGHGVPLAVAWEAGLAAARLISDAERRPSRQTSSSLRLRVATGSRTTRTHHPHAACRCRSLGGSATARGPEAPATTTARAFAQPA